MNPDWAGKLQVILLSAEEVIVTHSEKMKVKYRKDVWKSFIRKLAAWHLTTTLQIKFFTGSFRGF